MSKLTSLQQVHKHCINCDISHTAYYSQASGEAQYTTDIPTQPAELAAAFALTTKVRHYAQTAHLICIIMHYTLLQSIAKITAIKCNA